MTKRNLKFTKSERRLLRKMNQTEFELNKADYTQLNKSIVKWIKAGLIAPPKLTEEGQSQALLFHLLSASSEVSTEVSTWSEWERSILGNKV